MSRPNPEAIAKLTRTVGCTEPVDILPLKLESIEYYLQVMGSAFTLGHKDCAILMGYIRRLEAECARLQAQIDNQPMIGDL